MEYLVKVQNVYRVGTEGEALELREKLKKIEGGNLTGFSYNIKYIKQKGEIVDEYYLCKAVIEFNQEKECEHYYTIKYESL